MTLAHTPSTIALLLSHPAPLTKEVAATLPIEERGWYLHTVDPATGGPAPVTKLPIPAWEALVDHPVLEALLPVDTRVRFERAAGALLMGA